MNEKPQFWIEIWCISEHIINEQDYHIIRLPKTYNNKKEAEKDMEQILKDLTEFCQRRGNLKSSPGKIFNEQEYYEKTKGYGYTPP